MLGWLNRLIPARVATAVAGIAAAAGSSAPPDPPPVTPPAATAPGPTEGERKMMGDHLYKMIRASLDAAATTSENSKHWSHTDSLSARAAFSPFIRKTVRERSRLEGENNSWYAGILRTADAHIIGTGPRLQVTTKNAELNERLEKAWQKWTAKIGLAEKLHVALQTYWRDGEIFFMRRYRPCDVRSVPLDVMTFEADQVTNPYASVMDSSIDDGIRFDGYSNPTAYYFLDHHPGDVNAGHRNMSAGEWYPAEDVAHLFRRERPGQIRGIPRVTPGLELFPKLRRHTAATLLAAEAVANWTLFVRTNAGSIAPAAMPEDFVTLDFARNMMTFLPDGWDPFQLKAEQPTTNHEMFQRQTLMEICRCFCMPLLLACGTSKDSNFSSAQMDIRNIWQPEVIAEQLRIQTIVMDRVWGWFLEYARFVPGLLDGVELVDGALALGDVEHQWYWDPLPTTDETDQATAAAERLKTGQSTHAEEYARKGKDGKTAIERGATLLGITPAEYQRAIFNAIFPAKPDAMPPRLVSAPITETAA